MDSCLGIEAFILEQWHMIILYLLRKRTRVGKTNWKNCLSECIELRIVVRLYVKERWNEVYCFKYQVEKPLCEFEPHGGRDRYPGL